LRVGFRPVSHARHRHLELAVGDEGCFFLKRHEEQPFWTLQPAVSPAGSARPDPLFLRLDSLGYAKEIELARRCARLLRKPREGLTAESAEDRLLTAALLVKRYRGDPSQRRGFMPGGLNTQPIDAEESRLILSVLAEADLTASHPEADVSALGVFGQLGLGLADGLELPLDRSAIPEKARAWLKTHAGDYRIQQVLPGARGTKEISGLAAALIGLAPFPGACVPLQVVLLLASGPRLEPGQRPEGLLSSSPMPMPGISNQPNTYPGTPKSQGLTIEQKFCFFVGGGLIGLTILLYLAGKVWKVVTTRRDASFESPSTAAASPQTTGPYVPGSEPEISAGAELRQDASG
jgi:hypothetical protein